MEDRAQIARDVTQDLVVCEDLLNRSFAAVSALCSRIPVLETESRISPIATQRAGAKFTAAASALMDARGLFLEGHKRIDEVAKLYGITVVDAGPYDKPPNGTPPDGIADVPEMVTHR